MNRNDCILLGEALSRLKPLELKGISIINWIKSKKVIEDESEITKKHLRDLLQTYNIQLKSNGKEIDFDKTTKENVMNFTLAEKELLTDKIKLPKYIKCMGEEQFISFYERYIETEDTKTLDLIYEYFVENSK